MSNDLISRSAVMELIESRFVDGCLEMGDKTLIEGYDLLDDVSDLPTAYDVDKVVERIKNCDYCDSDGYLEPDAVIRIVKEETKAQAS